MVLSKVDSFGRRQRAETARQLSMEEESLKKIGPAI